MARCSGGGSARVGDCSWPPSMIMRGVVPSLVECRKVTLVNCSCHWVTSLVVSNRVDEVCETPLSRRTTKCWSTQRGLACWQAREPQEKNRLSLVICILLVIGLIFILWLVHPSTRRYNHPTHSLTFLQTSCSKLFSVIRFESLLCYLSSLSWAL